jgi:cell wall-associated NlpC family hydrolase
MRRTILICLSVILLVSGAAAQSDESQPKGFWDGIRTSIKNNLGRPYVWGATGRKSFDCSGFVWRVFYENGILMKRTTARKLYLTLPKAAKEDQTRFGTLVFFDDLKHIGIIDDSSNFYHAQVSIGTNRSPMNSFWRPKIYGYRTIPLADK